MRVYYQARWRSLRSLLVRVQVAPPSVDRNTPPESASTIAQTLLEFVGETATPILPMIP
jgi:hypothetical protein